MLKLDTIRLPKSLEDIASLREELKIPLIGKQEAERDRFNTTKG